MKSSNSKKYAVGLGITSTCNMGCNFCYSANRRMECADIPIKVWMDFFKRNKDWIKNINFGTGENTLVDEWFSLVEFIHKLDSHLGQALTTNGSLISVISNDKSKQKIVQKCISDIDVSLDYASEKKHNNFRGHDNAYQMALDTLRYCKEHNFNTTIVIMGLSDNLCIENLAGIFNIAKSNNALIRINIYRPVNKQNGLKPPSLNTLLRAFDWIYDNHEICSLSDPLFSATLTTSTKIHRDPSGLSSIRILPDGSIYPSTYLINKDYLLGHISDRDFFQKLQNNKLIESLTSTIPSSCLNCDVLDQCQGGVVDRRILSCNTVKKSDPYCPLKHNLPVYLRDYKVVSDNFTSIHDGYLPTLFFRPR